MTLMRTALVSLTSLLSLSSCSTSAPAVEATPRSAATLPLTSLDFDAPDDALLPLTQWLGDAEMVLLGENHHADAEGVAATVKLIRFLHERMNFTVLALEADLYGCTKAWEGIRQGDANAAQLCAYRQGSLTEASAPLWPYLAQQARTEHPLTLVGFDCQPSSDGSRQFLQADLNQVLLQADQALDAAQVSRATDAIRKLSTYAPRTSEAEHEADRAALQRLAAWLDGLAPNAALTAERIALFKQLSQSLLGDEAQEWAFQQTEPLGPGYHRSFNERDRQMAANLLWLRAQYPGEKIVVWGATGHVVRSLRSIPATDAAEATLFEPMGKHIARALGPKAVHIATLHHSGSVGMPNEPPLELPTAASGFLEQELHRQQWGPRLLIDLRAPDARTRWLTRSWPARWYLTKRPAPTVLEKPLDVADIILFLEQTRPHVAATGQPHSTK